MNDSPLLSREWNELVFENRNKSYGAYVLRKETGKRYRRVGMIFLGIFLVIAAIAAALGYFVYKKVQEISAEITEEVRHLEPVKTREGFERKNISVGRRAVKVATTPGGRNTAPVIVDRRTVAATAANSSTRMCTTMQTRPICPSRDLNSQPPRWSKRCPNFPAVTRRW